MDKTYDPKSVEGKIYQMWEKAGYFTPQVTPHRKPFTIILPLPNANDPMHMGHALFTVQDILIRWHRMRQETTLWLPGGDHAGIETQFVYEKKLSKEGKSRFDFDRDTLYRMISEFVDRNRDINKNQMKQLGFSLDWSRYSYSLDPKIVKIVLDTFRALHEDNLVYRAVRMVNFCTKCGTAFSDLEVNHEEKTDKLYYLDYGLIQIATARPETIFADVAVAVNPRDPRYKKLIGKMAKIPLLDKEIPIISDPTIEIDFGTGALKVTPAHDHTDYEIGQKHQLPVIITVDRYGRMINVPKKYLGLKINPARQAVTTDLQEAGKLLKTEDLTHTVSVCYRCKTTIEPMLMPQWFVKTKPLAQPAIEAVKTGVTKIAPLKRFEKMFFDWMENITDWNISRQIVWGPRIPVWYCLDCNPDININFIDQEGQKVYGDYHTLKSKYGYVDIVRGLQSIIAPVDASYALTPGSCQKCAGQHIIQETDTFDTWFLSGQWPYTTLLCSSKSKIKYRKSRIVDENPESDFNYFYPTSVLDTMWDILFFWVARMMMLGIYRTGQVPFKTIHLHSRVVDSKGQKMAKSRGNVINPIEMVDRFGADALRFSLIFGAGPGSDIALSEDKVRGMRNFANKLWNISRFTLQQFDSIAFQGKEVPFYDDSLKTKIAAPEKQIIGELNKLIMAVNRDLTKYRFSDAAQKLYEFTWHRLADIYIEESKSKLQTGDILVLSTLRHVLINILKLLHPFMPFITEEIWSKIPRKLDQPLIISKWPEA